MHAEQILGSIFEASTKGSKLTVVHFSSHWLFCIVGQHCGDFAASECTGWTLLI
jgi:hypothetical protein